MIYVYLSMGALVGVVVLLSGLIIVINARHNQVLVANSVREFDKEQRWNAERQQLLDRIQAPSYDHLKHHEAKILKIQNPGKEEPKLEVL